MAWSPQGGGGGAAWARGLPEAWFLSFGRWDDKRMAMAYAKDFQDPRVLGDLIVPWQFRNLAASQVWAGVQFATERPGGGGGASAWGGRTLTRMTLARVQEFCEPQGPGAIRDEVRVWGAAGGTMSWCWRSPHAQMRGPSRNPPPPSPPRRPWRPAPTPKVRRAHVRPSPKTSASGKGGGQGTKTKNLSPLPLMGEICPLRRVPDGGLLSLPLLG